ncbi:MAG: hypothetical protein ACT443_07650 [Gemmatimonadota bacterium]
MARGCPLQPRSLQPLRHVPGGHGAGAQSAPGILEAAGDAASSVFETIVEIIAGIFG